MIRVGFEPTSMRCTRNCIWICLIDHAQTLTNIGQYECEESSNILTQFDHILPSAGVP